MSSGSKDQNSGVPMECAPEFADSSLNRVPRHVGIIMDGNGRWATQQGLHRSLGHAKGSSIVKDIVSVARDLNIKFLSLYCFSTENWKRPSEEIDILMDLLRDYLLQERDEFHRGNIKLQALGEIERLPPKTLSVVKETIESTKNNTGMILNFCVSYGGRSEIVRALQSIAEEIQNGNLAPSAINEDLIASKLYTMGMPDPDLIIRTSGEFRTSNFLLWQSAYSEYYITDVLWPDFSRQDFMGAIHAYNQRKRRFGFSDESSVELQKLSDSATSTEGLLHS